METQVTETQLVKKPESAMTKVKNYILSPEVKERFSEMMGSNGIYYLNQVLILVANSDALQKCEPKSILIAAMRAASLRLSVDAGQGQAWIIPYKGVATFQIGYRGVYELALRTNLYRFINVIDIYEGETVDENRMTGIHTIGGKRTGNTVIARMLYFQLLTGFEKTFVMTTEEIEAHAQHYSSAYRSSASSKWNDPFERPKMERKTVLINGLRRWGRFNDADLAALDQIEGEQGWTGELPNPEDTTPPVEVRHTEAENMIALGFEPEPGKKQVDPTTGEITTTTEETTQSSQTTPAAPQLPKLRYQPEQLVALLVEIAGKNGSKTIEPTKRGLIAVVLEQALSMTTSPEVSRHQLLKYLTGKISLKDVSGDMALALYTWLSPSKDSGGAWAADVMAAREAVAAFNHCQPQQESIQF